MKIKSFRGQIADRALETIALHTNDGSTGYRIVKFQLFPAGATSNFDYESFVSIFKIPQTGTPVSDAEPDFSDQTLVACSYYSASANVAARNVELNVIFDNETFNQDITLSHSNSGGSAAINYYIELEQIKLDLNENTVATLKDIRNITGNV